MISNLPFTCLSKNYKKAIHLSPPTKKEVMSIEVEEPHSPLDGKSMAPNWP